jgi:hypothetical protein
MEEADEDELTKEWKGNFCDSRQSRIVVWLPGNVSPNESMIFKC